MAVLRKAKIFPNTVEASLEQVETAVDEKRKTRVFKMLCPLIILREDYSSKENLGQNNFAKHLFKLPKCHLNSFLPPNKHKLKPEGYNNEGKPPSSHSINPSSALRRAQPTPKQLSPLNILPECHIYALNDAGHAF